jgi:hypothetical protein
MANNPCKFLCPQGNLDSVHPMMPIAGHANSVERVLPVGTDADSEHRHTMADRPHGTVLRPARHCINGFDIDVV